MFLLNKSTCWFGGSILLDINFAGHCLLIFVDNNAPLKSWRTDTWASVDDMFWLQSNRGQFSILWEAASVRPHFPMAIAKATNYSYLCSCAHQWFKNILFFAEAVDV